MGDPTSHFDPKDDLGEAVDEALPKSPGQLPPACAKIGVAGGTARERVKFNLS